MGACFVHEHDKKLAVLGVTAIMGTPELPATIGSRLTELLSTLVTIMRAKPPEDIHEAAHLEVPSNSKMTEEMIAQDLTILGEAFFRTNIQVDDTRREENDATLAASQLKGPLTTFDEYDHLRTFFTNIK
jgi:hypothetical protein